MFRRLLFFCIFLAWSAALWAAPAPERLPSRTRAELEALLRHPGIQSGHVGIAVMALGRAPSPEVFAVTPYESGVQPLLFEANAHKRFVPASNMKLFTAAWVLQQLGPDFRMHTGVLAAPVRFVQEGSWPLTLPDPTVITLVGDGDPGLSSANLDELAGAIARVVPTPLIVRAQNSMRGDGLNGEEGGRRYPDGWTLDDATWYYGAPVVGLSVERNHLDVTLKGTQNGELAELTTSAPSPFSIVNLVTTGEEKVPLRFDRGNPTSPLGPELTVTGTLAPGQTVSEGIAVPDPKEWARQIFIAALQKHGATVVNPPANYLTLEAQPVVLHRSAPVRELLQRFLKSSDNLSGELLLRRAAAELKSEAKTLENGPQISSSGLAARGHRALAAWLSESLAPEQTKNLRFSDGSGLSRYNILTPIATAHLLATMQSHRHGAVFYDALPVAGVDGTLKNRMKGSAAERNARAKTGTFSIVNSLSGYVTTRDGQRLAVSILTNNLSDGELARRWQGRVFATLANASIQTASP